MKKILGVAVIAAVAIGASVAQAEPAHKKHYRTEPRAYQPRPPASPLNDTMGNAALGGNSANSASGSNSANENANGRSGGGFGG